jgi:NAD(P)-dependent dehydrogenase (short-subunit alcohol dehydrogenase family)
MGSLAGVTGGTSTDTLSYAATKAGVMGPTAEFGMALGPDEITVNDVAPGFCPGHRIHRRGHCAHTGGLSVTEHTGPRGG